MWCYSRGQTRQLCMLSVHIGLCLISLSLCRTSSHHVREPRLRKVSQWKAILSWISKPIQRIPDDKPFYVVWNAPSFRCGRQYGLPMDLDKFGIIENEFELFHGEAVNIFYESRLGLYPRYLPNNKPKYGGLPQLGNLTAHLDWVRRDLDWYIPNITYNGLAVIDWESWRPIFDRNWQQKYIYKAASINLVAKQHPTWRRDRIVDEAERQFEKAARDFMEKTLSLCRDLRPYAKWGFYLFPDCYNYKAGQEKCIWSVTKKNDRLSWLYRGSSALYPSIYLTDMFQPRDQQRHVRGILNEAYRVRKRFTSPFTPVIPYTKYVYTNTARFYDKQALENTIGEAMDSGATGVSLWDSSSNIQTETQCIRLHRYLNNVLGPYVKHLLEWSDNCSQNLCGGHGRCVSAEYQPRKSSREKVVIQKGPKIEKVVVSKESKTGPPSNGKNPVRLPSTTRKLPFTPMTGFRTKDYGKKYSRLNPIVTTPFFRPIPGFTINTSLRRFIGTTPKTLSIATLDTSTKRKSTIVPDGLETDIGKVVDLPLATKDDVKLIYQTPSTLITDRKIGSLPLPKTINVKHTTTSSPNNSKSHKVTIQKPGANQEHNLKLKTLESTQSLRVPGIHSSTSANYNLPWTPRPIVNSTSKALVTEQSLISKTPKKSFNQKLVISKQNHFPPTMSIAVSNDSADNIEHNGNTLMKDLKMYGNRSEMSLKRPITFVNKLDDKITNTTRTSLPLFRQSKLPLKFNSSVTPIVSLTTKDSRKRKIYKSTSLSSLGTSNKIVLNSKISPTTADPMNRFNGSLSSTINVTASSAENGINVGNVSNATKHSTLSTDGQTNDRGSNIIDVYASTYSKTSEQAQEHSVTPESQFNDPVTTTDKGPVLSEVTKGRKLDWTSITQQTTSPPTLGSSKGLVDGVFVKNTTGNNAMDRDIDDKHNSDYLSFTRMLVQVFIMLVVALRRFFSTADLQSDTFIRKPTVDQRLESSVNQYVDYNSNHIVKINEPENPQLSSQGFNQSLPQRYLGQDRDPLPVPHVLDKRMAPSSRLQTERVLSVGNTFKNNRGQKNKQVLTIGSGRDSILIVNDNTPTIKKDSLTFANQRKQPPDKVHINKSGFDRDPKDDSLSVKHFKTSSKHRTKTLNLEIPQQKNAKEYDNYVCRCNPGWTGEFCDTPK